MFEQSRHIALQFRALIIASLMIAWLMSASSTGVISIKQAVPDGAARIHLSGNVDSAPVVTSIEDLGKLRPEMVIINEATPEQLATIPGISRKIADRIAIERKHGLFYDWRDLQDRIKGLGEAKIKTLQELGVRLNR